MNKLVLVNTWKMIYPPLGLGYIASYLYKYFNHINVEIIDSSNNLEKKIIAAKPDILGFTASTPNYFDVIDIIKKVKESLNVPILLGGSHITSLSHKLSEYVDIGVIGEGEETVSELVSIFNGAGEFKNSDLKEIKGIVYHSNKKNVVTEKREPIEPIDNIPYPDMSLFDMEDYLKPSDILVNHEHLRGTSILTSRGCPYKCVYCQVPQQWGKVRLHSAEYVAEEINLLVEEYDVEGIVIIDDLFILSTKRIERLIGLLKEYGILGEVKFLVDGRSNLINEKLLKLLKQLNVVQMALGIESGSERVLNYLKKNSVTVEQNKNAVALAQKYDIGVYAQFMLGTPTETKEEMLETVKFIREQPLKSMHVSVTTPLPATELWKYCKKEGIVSDDMDWSMFNMEPQTNLKNNMYINKEVPRDEFIEIFKKAQYEIKQKYIKDATIKGMLKLCYVKDAVLHPKRAFMFAYQFIKNKKEK
jgi:radical SAM superfamily enzyme YgiQ (UPF0313 family)